MRECNYEQAKKRLPKRVIDEFRRACYKRGETPADAVNRFIREYVAICDNSRG